jgi:hypothetical protein
MRILGFCPAKAGTRPGLGISGKRCGLPMCEGATKKDGSTFADTHPFPYHGNHRMFGRRRSHVDV